MKEEWDFLCLMQEKVVVENKSIAEIDGSIYNNQVIPR